MYKLHLGLYTYWILTIGLCLNVFGNRAEAQFVLDAPFIYERGHLFGPYPENFNGLAKYEIGLTTREQALVDSLPNLYPSSYVYNEPEYARVRVVRSLIFDMNRYIKLNNAHDRFIDDGKKWEIIGVEGYKSIFIPKKKINMNPRLPFVVREMLGFNMNDLDKDSADWSGFRASNFYSWRAEIVEEHLENNYLKISPEGTLEEDLPYSPKEFEVINFEKHLRSILESGSVSAYAEKDFIREMLPQESVDSLNERIQGIRFMEDYYINQFTGEISSSIIGIGIVGIDTRFNQELLWMYYPEWRWSAIDKCVIVNDFIESIEYTFKEHNYTGEIERFQRKSIYHDRVKDMDYSVKLDHVVTQELHRERLALVNKELKYNRLYASSNNLHNMKLSELTNDTILYEDFYKNSLVAVTGKLIDNQAQGKFQYYFETGILKAERNFIDGKLVGKQFNYYPNGKIYMDYTIVKNEIQELTRFHEDGSLLEKGEFKNGIIYGDWYYRLKCTEEQYCFLLEHLIIPPNSQYENGAFDFYLGINRCEPQDNDLPNWYNLGKEFERICWGLDFELTH